MAHGLKDSELEKHYQALFAMYGSEGWKRTMEDLVAMHASANSLAGIDTNEQLWFRKGEIAFMEQMLSHQGRHEMAYAQLLADQDGTEEVQPSGGRAKVVE